VLRGVFSWGPLVGVEGEAHGFFVTEFQGFLTIQNFGDNTQTSSSAPIGTVDLAEWNHIIYNYSAVSGFPKEHSIYLNGKQIIRETATRPIKSKQQSILIGSNPVGGHEVFPGFIDDFRLYDRPLSKGEVQSLIDEQISSLSITRIEQGTIMNINNPKQVVQELQVSDDLESWTTIYSTEAPLDHYFDNGNQHHAQRYYRLLQVSRK